MRAKISLKTIAALPRNSIIHGWWVDRLGVDQAVQQVQDVSLPRDAGPQRQFYGSEHGLLVMLEDESQNLDHLAVAARRLKHALLQSSEGGGERAVAKCTRFALDDPQIVPPIENGRRTLSLVRAGASRPRRTSEGNLRRLAAKVTKLAGNHRRERRV
jgi:hypothetical protein